MKTSWSIARRAGQAGAQAGAAARRVHVCYETFACARTRTCVPYATYVCCDAYICAVALLYERMSDTCVLWLLQMCCGSCISDTCVLWLFVCATHVCCDSYISAVAHSSVNHTCVPWLMYECHDSYMCVVNDAYVIWRIYPCHDSQQDALGKLERMLELCCSTCVRVLWLIRVCYDLCMCAVTHARVPWLEHVCYDSFTRVIYIHSHESAFTRVMTNSIYT